MGVESCSFAKVRIKTLKTIAVGDERPNTGRRTSLENRLLFLLFFFIQQSFVVLLRQNTEQVAGTLYILRK